MTLSKAENKLFKEWKNHRDNFVSDGIVNEEAYAKSDKKLVFVLKEINSSEFGWDLREFLKNRNERSQTWNNVTRWVMGIREMHKDFLWAYLKDISKKQRIEQIRSICCVNLRKSPGGHTTDGKRLIEIAYEDKDYINRQINLYDADLIICCGKMVGDLFKGIMKFERPLQWAETRRGIQFYEFKPGRFIISYSHPEARVQDNILYYGLIDAVKEIYKMT